MILFDTNVVSALRARQHEPDPAFATWLQSADIGAAFLSVITVLELERGVLQLQRRDPTQGKALRAWLGEEILPHFSDRLLPIDAAVATTCAGLHVPNPRPPHDALIAATALVHDLTLATRNVRDFAGTGVRLVNPWDYRVGTGSAPVQS